MQWNVTDMGPRQWLSSTIACCLLISEGTSNSKLERAEFTQGLKEWKKFQEVAWQREGEQVICHKNVLGGWQALCSMVFVEVEGYS